MSTYKDCWYDVTVECDICLDMFDCEIQLYSTREVALVKASVRKLFTHCHHCGADGQDLAITVSNEYYTAEEFKQLRDNETKWIFMYRRRNDNKKDIL
ncbi:MAG: hypothetical protein SCH68_09490 [Brevefilum sp.]|nr:hypothetical protein [Brevefilum sp.]